MDKIKVRGKIQGGASDTNIAKNQLEQYTGGGSYRDAEKRVADKKAKKKATKDVKKLFDGKNINTNTTGTRHNDMA